jgi:hypothetical protein
MEFLEAQSVLGDTKTLLEFLIDCICIASQTPEWAFMRVDSGSANSDRNAQTVPFVKKIERKRRNFAKADSGALQDGAGARVANSSSGDVIWEIGTCNSCLDDQVRSRCRHSSSLSWVLKLQA